MMIALPRKQCNRYHRDTEMEGDQRTSGEEIWRKKIVVSRIEVQLEEDGGGSTRQSWMETSGLWLMFHWERQVISQANQVSLHIYNAVILVSPLEHYFRIRSQRYHFIGKNSVDAVFIQRYHPVEASDLVVSHLTTFHD